MDPSARNLRKNGRRVTRVILKTYEKSMPRKRVFRKSNPWTKELTKLKKEVSQKKKMIQELRESRNQRTKSEVRSSIS